MQVSLQPLVIEKELISSLKFNDKDAVQQHPDLLQQIKNATKLGNAYRSKVSILFQADDGVKCVNTTVWAFGAKFICLKGGIWLPISKIIEIKA